MVYLLYASAPKNNNLHFYGLSLASVLPTMPGVENYLYTIFPEDIQGRIEASEINLKNRKRWFQPPKELIFPYSNNQIYTFYVSEFSAHFAVICGELKQMSCFPTGDSNSSPECHYLNVKEKPLHHGFQRPKSQTRSPH